MLVDDNLEKFLRDLQFAKSFFDKYLAGRTETPDSNTQSAEERLVTTLIEGTERITKERKRLEASDPTYVHTDGIPHLIVWNSNCSRRYGKPIEQDN